MHAHRLIAVVSAVLAPAGAVAVVVFVLLSGPEPRDESRPFVPQEVAVASEVPEQPPRPASDPDDDDDNDEPDGDDPDDD